jgi:hypothetical protein
MALSFDPATHHNIPKHVVRVAWIASPKVAPRSGNEATKRPFLDQHAITVEIASNWGYERAVFGFRRRRPKDNLAQDNLEQGQLRTSLV